MGGNNLRYLQFDALRGLAAISVLFGHYIGMLPVQPEWLIYLSKTPIHIFWDGAAAVNLFFVLSGFCVALPYMRQEGYRPITYIPFLVRRIFRLYPAYFMTLFLCVLSKMYYTCPPRGNISSWGESFWQWGSLEISQWISLIGLIYHADTKLLDPPTWSLAVEMKMAFVLPIMFWVYRRLQPKFQIVLTTLLMVIMLFCGGPLNYACHFALGIMIANAKDFILNNIVRISKRKILLLMVFSLFFYTCRWPWKEIIIKYFGDSYSIEMLFEIFNGMGSALLLVLFFHP